MMEVEIVFTYIKSKKVKVLRSAVEAERHTKEYEDVINQLSDEADKMQEDSSLPLQPEQVNFVDTNDGEPFDSIEY